MKRELVPVDVTPAGVDLTVTALLLRAGLHGQEVPSYGEKALKAAIAEMARRLTGSPSRGLPVSSARQESWDAAVRYRPSAEQVRRHVAYCRAHGIDVDDSCTERWGWPPAVLVRLAPRPRKKGPHGLRTPATA